jgi:hypothetical protein
MSGSEIDWQGRRTLHSWLCVRCFRAVPATTGERYCINDGTWLLEACPLCNTPITSAYARFCAVYSLEFFLVKEARI